MSRGQHRAPSRWFRAPRGRDVQPAGRHSPEYVAAHQGAGVGMFPLGAAGRESLEQHHAAEPERGDRHSRAARLLAAANPPGRNRA